MGHWHKCPVGTSNRTDAMRDYIVAYACDTCRGTGEQLGPEECEVRCLLLDPPPEEEEEEEEERTSGCPDPVLFFNLSLRNFCFCKTILRLCWSALV